MNGKSQKPMQNGVISGLERDKKIYELYTSH